MVNQNSLELNQDADYDHDNVIYFNFTPNIRRLTKNLFLEAEKIQNDEPIVAEEIYLKSIEIDPNFYPSYINLGNIYFKLNDKKKAIDYYTKASEIFPRDHISLFNIGWVYKSDSKFAKSADFFKKSINANPKFYRAHYNLAIAYMDRGELGFRVAKKHFIIAKNDVNFTKSCDIMISAIDFKLNGVIHVCVPLQKS